MNKDNLQDLDLDRKMYEAKMKAFDEDLKAMQKKHKIELRAVNIANAQGIVEPKILKVPVED